MLTIDAADGLITFRGIRAFDHTGLGVSMIADFNGDGPADALIAAPDADPTGRSDGGQVFIVFGAEGFVDRTVDLDALGADDGVILDGPSTRAYAGLTVAGGGDFNGDGFADVAVSSPGSGQVFIVFGGSNVAIAGRIDLSMLGGTAGITLTGLTDFDVNLTWAGDLNDDGFDDLAVGRPSADPGGHLDAGEVVIVLGRGSGGSTQLAINQISALGSIRLHGVSARDRLGFATAAAGDVNGDGIDDLLLGAPGAAGEAGACYVLYGDAGINGNSGLGPAELDGVAGVTIFGDDVGERLGTAVAGPGDFDGDGRDDVVVVGTTAAYVLSGHGLSGRATPDLADLLGALVTVIEDAGDMAEAAGDVDGDGLGDVALRRALVFGRRQPATLTTADLADGAGVRLSADPAVALGRGGAGGGDFNHDGLSDVLYGADLTAVDGRAEAGTAILILGRRLTDCNGNRIDDACEVDCNGNGTPDECDLAEETTSDCNSNGVPDECEPPSDCNDNGIQDLCELDRDGDLLIDDCDGCPNDPAKIEPGGCGCGTPDGDEDNDGVLDCFDNCKRGDDRFDADGDGIPDDCDNCVLVPNPQQRDSDGDRRGDACAGDFDGDGIGDARDNCDQWFNADQLDTDGDGLGDGCDDDDDDDGVADTLDLCPGTPIGSSVADDGCPTVPPTPGEQPDLSVTLDAELVEDNGATKIRYTVTVVNQGGATARNVSIKATLDEQTALDAASNGGQAAGGDDITWPGFDLAAGGVVVRSYIVRVEVTDDGGNEIGGIVDVGSDDDDRNPVDNQDISGIRLTPSNTGTREEMCGAGAETPVAVASMLLMLTRLLPGLRRRRRQP